MTIFDFKSFLLTKDYADNKAFAFHHLMNNTKDTLDDLKNKTKEWNKKFRKVEDETIKVFIKTNTGVFTQYV